jgi:hypothetical protein
MSSGYRRFCSQLLTAAAMLAAASAAAAAAICWQFSSVCAIGRALVLLQQGHNCAETSVTPRVDVKGLRYWNVFTTLV